MYEKKIKKNFDCGVAVTSEIIGGKWKTCIIKRINNGTQRPGEIHKAYPDASPRVINKQLSELERHGIIKKNTYLEWPRKVEYALTPLGLTTLEIIKVMEDWGAKHKEILKLN